MLARIYPNGSADINDFQRAGGMAFLVRELRSGGLLNESVVNLLGNGLDAWCAVPEPTAEGGVSWTTTVDTSADSTVLATVSAPFADGGRLAPPAGQPGRVRDKDFCGG